MIPALLWRKKLAWLRGRKIELALFVLGVLLRASMSWNYRPEWSYDYYDHWAVVTWILDHHELPPVDALRESFHPPFFYVTAALLTKLGVTPAQMVALPIFCGTIRLGLIWLGLELYLTHSRLARVSALALAAVTAASVHIDGMVYSEALSCLWTTIAMLLAAAMFRSGPRRRWWLAVAVGSVLALAMLTKISAAVIILAIGSAAALEFLTARHSLRRRARMLTPWALALTVCIAGCGWRFAPNIHKYHRLFVTSFELPSESGMVAESSQLPYFARRSLDFVLGWDRSIFYFPYFSSAVSPRPQFFPVAVASTFVDYWNFAFSGVQHDTQTPIHVASGALTPPVLKASQFAVVGGTLIFFATIAAWPTTIGLAFRHRRFDQVALLLVPLFTLFSALYFAIAYPVDSYGVVKGVYMQFGAPPMYALFGLAVSWVHKKGDRWPLLVLLFGALWCVTAYTVYCRLRLPLLPIS